MPMTARGTGDFNKLRILISGMSQSGKTFSLRSFIYGNYDYFNEEEREEAIEYAAGKSMVILSAPGETGVRSLPEDTEHITSYYEEVTTGQDISSYAYSCAALDDFNNLYKEVEKNKPDILAIDGGHVLYDHIFNKVTQGQWLSGEDMNINNETGKSDKYRAARFHDTAQKVFVNYLGMYNSSAVPLFIMTVWEDWKAASSEGDRPQGIEAKRYLWPALAGAMSTKMPGKFDARLSARLERQCMHKNCEHSKNLEEHHVWQIYPKNDVMGIGVKGLKMSPAMMSKPWIHQSWPVLKSLIERV